MNRTSSDLSIAVLAAGAGTRMQSSKPKPLHAVGGLSLLGHAMRSAATLDPTRLVVVVGEGGDAVAAEASRLHPSVAIAPQPERLGTGDAVRCALPALEGVDGRLLVIYGDTPFLTFETLRALASDTAAITVLGFEAADPGRYGRLVGDTDGALRRIVEAADATEAERAITLCNAGVMALDLPAARDWLARLGNANAKGEFYLTDLVAMANEDGAACQVVLCPEAETMGVNSRAELAGAEAVFQRAARLRAMEAGVTLVAPDTVFFSHDTRIERDVVVAPHVVFGPGVIVGEGTRIEAYCHLEGSRIAPGATVGPFARLRPGTEIATGARVGNFVEIKNAVLGQDAKANHLAYVGDAVVGARANLGAGTITCNYDGKNKHKTIIGDDVFVGSNSALVAPLTLGSGAYVGSGSVITEDVPRDALAIGRGRQTNKPGLAARLRRRLGLVLPGERN